MIEGMVFNDMNSIASPLVELAKQYDQLPMSELCKSLDNQIDTSEVKPTGGRYGELRNYWGWNSIPPHEVHHMPADSVSTLDRNDGPAIAMEYEDHKLTSSCGNSRDAQEYRAEQKRLIEEGKFQEAYQMDVDDLREKFGNKYDSAIEQTSQYVDYLLSENKVA